MRTLMEKIFEIHDITCNQKYDRDLPYSFHLKAVYYQAIKFYDKSFKLSEKEDKSLFEHIKYAALGHDLIEDARMTYNDVCNLVREEDFFYDNLKTPESCKKIADIIYACTEEKGKTRSERHSQKFFDELKQNRLAVYVKLCDIMANVLYSKLTASLMFSKYRNEFHNLKDQLYIEGEYEVLWNSLELELFN